MPVSVPPFGLGSRPGGSPAVRSARFAEVDEAAAREARSRITEVELPYEPRAEIAPDCTRRSTRRRP